MKIKNFKLDSLIMVLIGFLVIVVGVIASIFVNVFVSSGH